MKSKLFVALLAFAGLFSGCAQKIRFDQTCLTCVQSQRLACSGNECPSSFMMGSDCVVTMVETGENIFLNEILMEEKISAREGLQFTLAKINSRYFVIGEGFKNMWILTPRKENAASLDKILLPEDAKGIPVFELYNKQLLMRGANNEYAYLYDEDGNKWVNKNFSKAGE